MSSKSRKRKKSIWRSKFYRVYFVLVALALVAIIIGTFWLQGVLRDYESAQPKYVAEDVAKLFENADYEAIYLLDTSAGQFQGDEALYAPRLNIEVKSTVGAGDSMVAGLACRHRRAARQIGAVDARGAQAGRRPRPGTRSRHRGRRGHLAADHADRGLRRVHRERARHPARHRPRRSQVEPSEQPVRPPRLCGRSGFARGENRTSKVLFRRFLPNRVTLGHSQNNGCCGQNIQRISCCCILAGSHNATFAIIVSTPWERGGIGRRSGLKIRHLRICGFESHRPYHGFAIM